MPELPQLIEQALFGYDDGHRLLESSTRLVGSERERLLLLSDLGPGLSGLRADGYWTGSPLPETERYALMRTWPAPEMPRPGCVWTHVLLIPFEYVRKAWTLEGLTRWVLRPRGLDARSAYRRSISPEDTHDGESLDDQLRLSAWDVVRCLYYTECKGEVQGSQDALGQMAVKVWSQQWPELRCTFSFRTIGRPARGSSSLLTFDLGVTEGHLQFRTDDPTVSQYLKSHQATGTREALGDDLAATALTKLRTFVTLYGRDFPKHGQWVAFLASMRERTESLRTYPRVYHSEEYRSLLEDVGRALPSRTSGLRLKADLLTFGPDSSFRLPQDLFLAALEYLSSERLPAQSFPELRIPGPLVAWAWDSRRERLLAVIRNMAGRPDSLTAEFIGELSHVSDIDGLMDSVADIPDVRSAMVRNNPALLRWKGLLCVHYSELLSWIDDLSGEQVRELDLIPRLLATDSMEIAKSLCSRFPGDVVRAVCLGRGRLGPALQINDRILVFAGEAAPRFLRVDFLNTLNTTSALWSFGSMLGFVNPQTVAAGAAIWVPALRKATKDSPGGQTQVLSAFLLALGLARPEQGSEFIFEYTFDPLHRAMRDSMLDYQASVILEQQLPEVSWWRRWDSCQRLRLAVVRAFVHGNLNPNSFLRVTPDPSLMSEVFEQLESIEDGRFYLEQVRRQISSAEGQRP
jgi:hypothetical protein